MLNKIIDPEINKLFTQLKSEGYVMVYNDNIASKFKVFLEYIEYPFTYDNLRNHHVPERNRFEKRKKAT